MTIASEDARTGPYTGNGATTVFAYDFKVSDEAHLVVTTKVVSTGVETVQTLTTHYSVSGVGSEGGGNVTMVTFPASTETLTISRTVPRTQGTDLQNRGATQPATLEAAYDKSVQISQDLAEVQARTMKFAVSSDLTSFDTSIPSPVALKAIAINAAGTAFELVDEPSTAAAAAAASAAAALLSENNSASSESTAAAYAVKVDGAASGSDHSSKAWAVGGTGITDTASKGASKEWASNPEDDTVAGAGTFSALHYSAKASGFATAASVSADASAASAVTASAAAAGIYWKEPVVNRSTGNLTLSGEQTIDGILTSTSRILVMDQSSAAENGIYVTASGAWARAVPLDTYDEHVGAVVLVSQGTAYSDQAFMCTVDPGGVLGSTSITWAAFGAVAVNFKVDSFETSTDYTAGTTTTLVITTDAGSEENIRVSFDGVVQHHSTYTYTSGTRTITFDAAIPIGTAEVECQYGSSVGIGTPSDGTVSAVKIASNAVETAKIADNAVTLAKMAGGTAYAQLGFDANGDPAEWVAQDPDVQLFTTSGTWTKPTGFASTAQVLIEVWGAGGGGGGSGSSAGDGGGGAGGGSYNSTTVDLSTLAATETVTIGAGATGGTTTADGGVGGSTTFGAHLTGFGGGGGGNGGGKQSGAGGGSPLGAGQTAPNTNGGNAGTGGGLGGASPGADGVSNDNGGGGAAYNAGEAGNGGLGGGGGGSGTGGGTAGGTATYGGGGGGGGLNGTGGAGGVASIGGNGGAGGSTGAGVDGTQPSGGGGGAAGGAGFKAGDGAAGQCRVTVTA